jgi:hypothetical protein
VTPLTAFRIGVDGSSVPIPGLSGISVPFIPGNARVPGANQPYANSVYNIDPAYRPSPNSSWNFTIQWTMPGNGVLELGYAGRHATGLYSPIDLNAAPFFMTVGGQSFAQAFDAVAAQLRAGNSATPQPFFEKALAGSAFCKPTCTAGVAAQYGGHFLSRSVYSLWNGIQPSFVMGAATPNAGQTDSFFFYTNQGWSNYNAAFVSYRARNRKGLSLDANLTIGHSLDASAFTQNIDTAVSNSYNLRYDYGPSLFDRRVVFNLLGVYELPFGRRGGNRIVNAIARDWSIAPIFAAFTGLPLDVSDGSCQEFGQGSGICTDAILTTRNTFGHSAHMNMNGNASTGVGISASPASGGSGINMFADPSAAYASFRPVQISTDTTSRGGILRGQNRWNFDLSIVRKIRLTERVSSTFSATFLNAFNHVEYYDPSLNLQAPASFGVISGQYNTPRVIEFGLRLDF